eukprot:g5356.t1
MMMRRSLTIRKFVGSMSRRQMSSKIVVDNPYTGETYCEVESMSESTASEKIGDARAAFEEWRHSSMKERLELCENFMSELEKRREDIAKDVSGMMGKPYTQAFGEFGGVYERTKGMMKYAPDAMAEEIIPSNGNGCDRVITREPVGVVLVIAPWNFPLLTAVNAIVPAILAGNAVVLKHSERTPLCGEHFAKAFEAAGAPKGLVSFVNCSHDVSATMIADRRVGFVSFTGSVRGGREIYSTLAQSRFIDATLELGGKDPAYVAEDFDAAEAAAGLVDGAMYNMGQSCCGVERVYVHKSRYQEFLHAAQEICEMNYVWGDPMNEDTNHGPQALSNSVPFLSAQVQDAENKGARIVTGFAQGVHDETGRGRFFAPTIVADCNHEMDIMKEESFGPVLPVMPVDSEEQAVKLMSDSEYGLTAAIFTKDQERVRRMGAQLPAGTVFMNRCDYLDPDLPWTAGNELTGKGVSLSRYGFDGVTKLKGYNMKV